MHPIKVALPLAILMFLGTAHAADGQAAATLKLDATATAEVPEDTAWANLLVEREAKDASDAQRQVSSTMTSALAQAKRVAGLDAKTEGFYTNAVYGKDGKITGWRSRAELRIESKDASAVTRTAADLNSVARLAGAGFYLSSAARMQAEKGLVSSAVQEFRAKAKSTAEALGFAKTEIQEVALGQNSYAPRPVPYFAAKSLRGDIGEAAVPLEPGKSQVSVTVSGSVALKN